MTYKYLAVYPDTHKRVKSNAAESEQTIDEYVNAAVDALDKKSGVKQDGGGK
jgi:hypothetical protein